MGTLPLCDNCGHDRFAHTKGGLFSGCVITSPVESAHTFSGALTRNVNEELLKLGPIFRPPMTYLKLNNTPNDESVLANNGTWTGVSVYTTGVVAPTALGAALFDGTVKRITLANESNFDFTAQSRFSITGWTRRDVGGVRQTLIGKRTGVANVGWDCRFGSADNLRLELESAGNVRIARNSDPITDTNFHHFAFTSDGLATLAGLHVYIDSILSDDGGTDGAIGAILNGQLCTLGAMSGGGDEFTGALDNIAIWDYVLPVKVIRELYNNGVGIDIMS